MWRYCHHRINQWRFPVTLRLLVFTDVARGRAACSRSTSRIFGTDTTTEIRRLLICATMSTGLYPRMKTTTPGSIGGVKVAMAWPNMWLSGRRFGDLNGKKGGAHFRYFTISRSIGANFATTVRCG